ncbi:MAG: hypothetical protein H6713_13445 [Myxococcales bacterium]|nr:hypothetical protein [Myxococcales bacterium]MCB9750987.1 hypothetical protein [Myxococcales bacterium]
MTPTRDTTPSAALLGPQRLAPTLAAACDALSLAPDARVAVITAGWQERELEHDELFAALARPAVNLRLHARAEWAFERDGELFVAHRSKQDALKQLQGLYRRRLRHVMDSARELLDLAQHEHDSSAEPTARARVAEEIDAALEDVRRLDVHHLERVLEIERAYRERQRPQERAAVLEQRAELEQTLAGCQAIAVAGGHVATILERLKLFELGPALRRAPVIAWSAGAMALSDRIVLFHDCPPQGRGDAEVLHAGLGVFPGVVPLPHARHRLLLEDSTRVALFARRFAPAVCVALDERCGLYLLGPDRAGHEVLPGTRVLQEDGSCH